MVDNIFFFLNFLRKISEEIANSKRSLMIEIKEGIAYVKLLVKGEDGTTRRLLAYSYVLQYV